MAILSKQPLHDIRYLNWVGVKIRRHLAATLDDGTHIHNFYIPAGGDVADPEVNDKFAHNWIS